MDITIGYTLAKPVQTQAQCDAYAAMAKAVDAHNAACAVGDTLWSIEEEAARKRAVDNLVKLSRSFEEAERFIIVTLEEEETIEIAQTTIEVIPLYKYLTMRDCSY